MTNDLSTLSGALLEMKDQLIYELGQKGVTASYDSTTGLLGLIGRIADIQTGGGSCYHIEFDQSSYVAVGGSVTVSFTLQSNYAPLGSATVTLSDGSSQYSCITNSDGVGTYTFTGLNSDKTLTASYQGVSDSCSVNVPNYLFYDACDSTYDSSKYGTPIGISSSPQTNYTAYNSTENAYWVRADKDWGLLPIPALTGLDNYKISAYFKPKGSNSHLYRGGFGFLTEGTTSPFISWRISGDGTCTYTPKVGNSEPNTNYASGVNLSVYHKIEVTKQGNNYTTKIYDTDDTTVLGTSSVTYSLNDDIVVGLYLCCGSSYGCYVKEIKAEPI